ncbi:MAG: SIMPL domain-containing protein [Clostridiales bacterium]|nr:SIMPL domain-containing protein [Clostridiales bacterium]
MDRIITVKGTGRLSLRPDRVTVELSLNSRDRDYYKAMKIAEQSVEALSNALEPAGFKKDDIKTVHFGVSAEYDNVRENGVFKNVFSCYAVSHRLRIAFPFGNERLSNVLTAAARSVTDPDLFVSFSVSDTKAAEEELMKLAAKDARKRAETLAEASSVKLGALQSIDYDSNGLSFVSPTNFSNSPRLMKRMDSVSMEVSPEDVSLEKSAVFVWALE